MQATPSKTWWGGRQALSKRIHYGKFVAEAKFKARPDEYSSLIRRGDVDGIMKLLTDERVEALVCSRFFLGVFWASFL